MGAQVPVFLNPILTYDCGLLVRTTAILPPLSPNSPGGTLGSGTSRPSFPLLGLADLGTKWGLPKRCGMKVSRNSLVKEIVRATLIVCTKPCAWNQFLEQKQRGPEG